MKTSTLLALILGSSLATAGQPAENPAPAITQDQLVRWTQELCDALAPGDRRPAETYFADNLMLCDETGQLMGKHVLLDALRPLPQGYAGTITVQHPQARVYGDTAVLSYDLDESETVFGQALHARYHQTDTWRQRDGRWQIVAAQVLRYYEDPAPGRGDPENYPAYAGTYRLGDTRTLIVSVKDGVLHLASGSRPPARLLAEAPGLFFRPGAEGRILFRRDASGAIDALIQRRNNEDIVWLRVP